MTPQAITVMSRDDDAEMVRVSIVQADCMDLLTQVASDLGEEPTDAAS